MSIDSLFHCKYDRKSYNCAHFVADTWLLETGKDITEKLHGFLFPPKDRFVPFSLRYEFIKLTKPVSPCIVIMRRSKYPPHVGTYLRGKVLHIQENGPQYQPIEVATIGFSTVRFYTCK